MEAKEIILMTKRIYVGNLPFSATEADMKTLFSEHGEVTSVSIVSDRETGRSRGFAFVEMEDASADKAIEALNNAEYSGRKLRVNEARERTTAPRRNNFRGR